MVLLAKGGKKQVYGKSCGASPEIPEDLISGF
jgi:hypothetical protein